VILKYLVEFVKRNEYAGGVKTYGQYCALARGLDMVGDRWTLLIVRELLSLGECRYSDLQRGLPGIATNLLAQRLREMEEAGLVRRIALPPPVNAVVFALTERGEALHEVVREFVKWGAPLMAAPSPDDTFRSHWLLLPLRGLCRDNDPRGGRVVVRVGTVHDGCDITAQSGVIKVNASHFGEDPHATVTGDPGGLVALFTGQLLIESAGDSGVFIDGDISAVRRVIGGMVPAPMIGA
jgi:DNA-binding HxlR family transcriptional regulator